MLDSNSESRARFVQQSNLLVVVIPPECLIAAMTGAALAKGNALPKACVAETGVALADVVEAQKRLGSIVRELRRERFGRKSERLDPKQFYLPLEVVERRKRRDEP
ncbi:transposase [uncultured Mameliella sp.]|uniref:transposase n=1 Tax=uncultured Mameliella sp. TaxID=1447087 RepID=UPI00260EF8FD|nr:transposase [uncultured Mameliella sp.]